MTTFAGHNCLSHLKSDYIRNLSINTIELELKRAIEVKKHYEKVCNEDHDEYNVNVSMYINSKIDMLFETYNERLDQPF